MQNSTLPKFEISIFETIGFGKMKILDTKIFYVGGVGRMDLLVNGYTVEVTAEAKARGCVTNLDAFASTSENLR